MLRVLGCVALFLSGCAFEEAAPRYHAMNIARAKIGTSGSAKGRLCTTTVEPAVEIVCKQAKNCDEIESCDEAYYRLKKCGHRWLDAAGIPSKMNDIPCETGTKDKSKACGRTISARDEARAKWPFTPPLAQSRTECKAE